MTAPRNLSRITANLENMGMGKLLSQFRDGTVKEQTEYYFGSLSLAKQVQGLLYGWLFFFPDIKKKVSLRLNNETATLTIIPRTRTEKRGRGKIQ